MTLAAMMYHESYVLHVTLISLNKCGGKSAEGETGLSDTFATLTKNHKRMQTFTKDYFKNSDLKVIFLKLFWFTAFQINSKIKFYPAPLPLKWQLYGAFQPADSGKLIY